MLLPWTTHHHVTSHRPPVRAGGQPLGQGFKAVLPIGGGPRAADVRGAQGLRRVRQGLQGTRYAAESHHS
eukprot:42087-Eustigmatos_ZCMA.PRE.1